MTEEAPQDARYLRRRIEALERRIEETEQALKATRRREALYLAFVKQLRLDLDAITASARWRLGHAVISFVERILGRGRPTLVIDYLKHASVSIEERALRESRAAGGSLLSRLQEHASFDAGGGAAVADQLVGPPDLSDSRFMSWLASRFEPRVVDELSERLSTIAEAVADLTREARVDELPLVSVIMPCYNREATIEDAIQSVLEQSYPAWELIIVDDGSTDATVERIAQFPDQRINLVRGRHAGAAAARNRGLSGASGEFIAYLDSDNLWHPDFLAATISGLLLDRGHWALYADYFDVELRPDAVRERATRVGAFDYEQLAQRNFIDLNSFVHRRSLLDRFGGFTESLPRQQDWDLILKYSFLRDPTFLDLKLAIYRRDASMSQLTDLGSSTKEQTRSIIEANLETYYTQGLPVVLRQPRPSITVIVWDVCRNHFSKAYNIAEALASFYEVQLIGFDFFGEGIFGPYADAKPSFELVVLPGGDFPSFEEAFAAALLKIRGNLIYCVKPRLPSLGLALLHNYHFGTPVIVETNDLESQVTSPDRVMAIEQTGSAFEASQSNPYSDAWTAELEQLLPSMPFKVTHNANLDMHAGGGCWFVRNPKDEIHFDPERYDRSAVRADLGLSDGESVILFAGLPRRHKGLFELENFLGSVDFPCRLLVIGSRPTPDLEQLRRNAGDRVLLLPPRDRNAMAKVTCAADAVVLWLDPATPASHCQMPFKLTDALAMRVPVIGNSISDLEGLIDKEVMLEVPYGDYPGLAAALRELRESPEQARAMTARARRLYLRQFGYRAVRSSFALMIDQVLARPGTLAVAEQFADRFSDFLGSIRR